MPSLDRRFRNLRYEIFYGLFLRNGYKLQALGNAATECRWIFCPAGLDAKSVVYSGGVGRDISFEHELVERFGCCVHLYDPSPTGDATMRLPENRIEQLKFSAVGLAGKPGVLHLAPPQDTKEGSWFQADRGAEAIEVPCKDLATLMRENGHTHIDLLKIDIEGAEYEVLDSILSQRLDVRQVLVEFHHGILPGITRGQSILRIVRMTMAGFRLVKQDGSNHTFVRAVQPRK